GHGEIGVAGDEYDVAGDGHARVGRRKPGLGVGEGDRRDQLDRVVDTGGEGGARRRLEDLALNAAVEPARGQPDREVWDLALLALLVAGGARDRTQRS